MGVGESLLAVYMDIENAFPEFSGGKLRYVFDRLAGIGSIAVCRGYADWSKLGHRSNVALEWNVSTVHLFVRGGARKNAADIAITVDAMEQLYLVPTITTFVIISGDSDLAPLATRIRERGKEVIGISRRDVASEYLVKACDRFIYLEDLLPQAPKPKAPESWIKIQVKLIKALKETVGADGWAYAAAIKQKLSRTKEGFDEKAAGYKTFTQFLESYSSILEVSRSATGVAKARLLEKKVAEPVPQDEVPRLEGEPAAVEEQPPTLGLDEARDLLARAMESSEKAGGEADLSWLKTTMTRMAPGFSEEPLGFRRFLDFVRRQNDLVQLEKISPTQWRVYPSPSSKPDQNEG